MHIVPIIAKLPGVTFAQGECKMQVIKIAYETPQILIRLVQSCESTAFVIFDYYKPLTSLTKTKLPSES